MMGDPEEVAEADGRSRSGSKVTASSQRGCSSQRGAKPSASSAGGVVGSLLQRLSPSAASSVRSMRSRGESSVKSMRSVRSVRSGDTSADLADEAAVEAVTAERTPSEIRQFELMLGNVNLLYLGMSVLVLMDRSYLSRFWTQFEAWLGLQDVTSKGLTPPAAEATTRPLKGSHHEQISRRMHVCMVHGAPETLAQALYKDWSDKSPEQARKLLMAPDVSVTNLKDKTKQLKKLEALDLLVRRLSGVSEAKLEAAELNRRVGRLREELDKERMLLPSLESLRAIVSLRGNKIMKAFAVRKRMSRLSEQPRRSSEAATGELTVHESRSTKL